MLKQLTQQRAEQQSNHPSHTIRILYDERQLRNTCMAAHLPTLCTAQVRRSSSLPIAAADGWRISPCQGHVVVILPVP
jgi:hypothetical protein